MNPQKWQEIRERDDRWMEASRMSETATVHGDRHHLRVEVERLREENSLLMENPDQLLVTNMLLKNHTRYLEAVLDWYAHDAWEVDGTGRRPIDADCGARAATARRGGT